MNANVLKMSEGGLIQPDILEVRSYIGDHIVNNISVSGGLVIQIESRKIARSINPHQTGFIEHPMISNVRQLCCSFNHTFKQTFVVKSTLIEVSQLFLSTFFTWQS